ncbi:MAG: LysM peptidoglycan-binding domain-containing protein [Muribaculaceae bacterium]|nr:LysM peptidoglycan-binding domain-containing protein [Muribaculaceae bacterium]
MSNHKSERRIQRNRIRRQQEMRRHLIISILTVCLVVIFSIGISSFRSNAKDNSNHTAYKYYKSITISHEDTLWSIAKEYMDSEHYDSIYDYMNEVKQINSLDSDDITYGNHLIIAYYSDEYR